MQLKTLHEVRHRSEALIDPLEPEDLGLQGMADASPPKWHLAHTNWFFETFLLQPHLRGHDSCDPRWAYQFNSYYDAIGDRHPRPKRGLLSRPTINEILRWRSRVNEGLEQLLRTSDPALLQLMELGLQHEQQHQELLLMDVLDGFSRQPLEPCYHPDADLNIRIGSQDWLSCDEGLVSIGHGGDGFHFDNEAPRHRVWLDGFLIRNDLVSNREFQAFIKDGGYSRPDLWMTEGWSLCQRNGWTSPRYWRGDQEEFTLAGRQPLDPEAPVRHLSWFEADAFARWSDARLPTEAEWEHAAAVHGEALLHSHGVLWQWTASPYRPYPGFTAPPGAIGEYNGKFMSSQFVLRGSCWLTPPGHGRDTYRNFFPPASRWMAAGLRLAR
ncbi:MAG: ergothioneine biosynthesis protein EgtB [Synechococcus sp.]|nr:ergothioneine biosynthesis protein EgtB [Synechococcus sp.]